jgi:hypothetical protein
MIFEDSQGPRVLRPLPAESQEGLTPPRSLAIISCSVSDQRTPADRPYNCFAGAKNPKDWNLCRNRPNSSRGASWSMGKCGRAPGARRKCAFTTGARFSIASSSSRTCSVRPWRRTARPRQLSRSEPRRRQPRDSRRDIAAGREQSSRAAKKSSAPNDDPSVLGYRDSLVRRHARTPPPRLY